jgi:glycosyltransferase involved in cell wall biosynthesis
MKKLKILWQSNAYWSPSGYSNVTKDMYKNFRENGWTPETLTFLDMYGLQGGILKDEFGFNHYPIMDHIMGSDAMLHHSKALKSDIVITLQDIWPLNPQDLSQVPNWIPWAPIDYNPIPKAIMNNLRFANRIISMSKFGESQLKENGFSSYYIPHGVNTNIFKPLDKKQRKIDIGLNPDTIVFGMISANKESINPRKSFQQAMEAFAMFIKKKPNSLLYIHTDPDFPGGFPLKQLAADLGILNQVGFPDRYKQKYNTSKEEMNLIYNSFDVLLSPSSTEGFCIPIIEAQACGLPVIVNDWCSMPELIKEGETGFTVKHVEPTYYPIGSYVAFPDTKDLYEKMLKVTDYTASKWEKPAREFVLKNYDQDMLFQTRWLPFLEQREKELYHS